MTTSHTIVSTSRMLVFKDIRCIPR